MANWTGKRYTHLQDTLDMGVEVARQYVRDVLWETRGSMTKAAVVAGCTRKWFHIYVGKVGLSHLSGEIRRMNKDRFRAHPL